MPSPRQMVVVTLKGLANKCLQDQIELKRIRSAQRILADKELELLNQIRESKNRIDRELVHSSELLEVEPPGEDSNDQTGED